MSAKGHERQFGRASAISGLPLIADMGDPRWIWSQRAIRVVSAMSAASLLYLRNRHRQRDRPRRKMPTGDIALAASCCATITPE
jgi:hypothetical protein